MGLIKKYVERERNIIEFEDTLDSCHNRSYPSPINEGKMIGFCDPETFYLDEDKLKSYKKEPVNLEPFYQRTYRDYTHVVPDDTISFILSNYDYFKTNPPLVLNFASPFTPGGGVKRGSSAQEENLCQRTTLYASLTTEEAELYYYTNKMHSRKIPGGIIGNNGAILSKYVAILKDKDFNYLNKPIYVDILTMAAPRLRKQNPLAKFQIEQELNKLIKYIFCINRDYVHDCDIILGAFGCGTFKNDPALVSGIMKKYAIAYAETFDEVWFPIPPSEKNDNLNVFLKDFDIYE